ncbi:unnamed protein product [Prunus armeniaca]|uniref:Uncharacterized protein n=1 Tax=Prunus armeniaca TaxID=36596 RepID=A0A6J5VT73_PRUAR|nr:unnamed protein product [Prunus armeniaca]
MRNTTSTTWRSSATSTLTATMPSLVSTVASRTKSKLLFSNGETGETERFECLVFDCVLKCAESRDGIGSS